MLDFGPLNRRSLLQRSGMGIGALGLAGLLLDDPGSVVRAGSPEPGLGQKLPHFPGRVKRVIHFFCNGGPSHVDTFDPKPALTTYAGKPAPINLTTERKTGAAFPSPFKFQKYGQSGLEISELFAKTAEHADDMAVIRSMYAQVPNHEPSLMLMNCGDSVQSRPSVGAWVMYGLGAENRNLPGFIAMCPNGMPIKDSENWQSGFLPGIYQGTFIDPQHRTREADREHPQPARLVGGATKAARPAPGLELAASRGANGFAARCPHPVVRAGLPHADRSR